MAESLGIGPHGMWGFSPALDLSPPAWIPRIESTEGPISILLANPADVRHVLRTIASRRRHSEKPPALHFYIWDRPMEVHARHLALIHLARDQELPIRQRANLWLEVFGNTLVQERTEQFIGQLGREMVRLVCDGAGLLSSVVDLSLLKFRERDALEATFKTWAPNVPYDVALLRDTRLRRLFDQRYDQRKSVIDWDYHEGVKPVASIVHYKQYMDWRQTGVAFEFGDQTYTRPNRTMASYAEGTVCKGKDRGMKKEVRGYWVDLVISPFMAMGVDCDKPNQFAEELFLIHNKGTGCAQHRHHAVEVAVYNLLSYMWETETGTVYQMTREHDVYSGLGEKKEEGSASPSAMPSDPPTPPTDPPAETPTAQVQEISPEEFERLLKLQKSGGGAVESQQVKSEAKPAQVQRGTSEAPARAEGEEDKSAEAYEGVKIFLVGDDFRSMYGKKRFQGLFDVVSLSVGASHFMADEQLRSILAPTGAYVTVENAKYVVPLHKKGKVEYVGKVKDMAKQQGWADDFGKKKRNIEDLLLRDQLPFIVPPSADAGPSS